MLAIALQIALLNRYEICVVMLLYLFVESRFNPIRRRRWLVLVMMVGALNFIMPIVGAQQLAYRFEEAQYAGVIRALDLPQLRYLYFVAVIPKIADNLFGQIPNPAVWRMPSSWLYINFFNSLSYVVLIAVNAMKRRLTLRSDLIYLGVAGSVMIAQSLVVQPRYFYFLCVLLCLRAAEKSFGAAKVDNVAVASPRLQHA